ncbi:MAG: hypothetical protein CVV25_02840 [Ignavibacteriae bacterium HGW-Ignavibacteriae-4]|jgi:hypothetical protein|nr:MAG: hypothetical protein CVV25_02840 [Ignavibacteriae bacterium HGW-Ignavibacteriae-4]
MKKYSYILLFVILLFTACKEPNPTEPDTKWNINEVLEYRIIDQTELGFESEVINEMIIRDDQELKRVITNNSNTYNLELIDNLLNLDLSKDILIIISGNTFSEKATIYLDSIYLDNLGQIQLNYSVYRKLGLNSRVSSPTLAILVKNRKQTKVKFNRRFEDDGDVQNLDGFKTIAEDITVEGKRKWKVVFNTADEFKQWANEYKLAETDFINGVDFTTEMVISVGNSNFNTGIHKYNITDIKQQGSRIIVNSNFLMIKTDANSGKHSNHFVKIKKTGLPIYFNPTIITNNVFPAGKFYYENYRTLNKVVSEKTSSKVLKVSNMAELFGVIVSSDDMNPSNLEVDFEFFDLLVIKSPTMQTTSLKSELDYLRRDDWGILGKAIFYPDITGDTKSYDAFTFIRILKTNIPISKNFEVTVK